MKEAIVLVGSIFASAERHEDGTYTDKGNAQITAAKVILHDLHAHDNGVSLNAVWSSDSWMDIPFKSSPAQGESQSANNNNSSNSTSASLPSSAGFGIIDNDGTIRPYLGDVRESSNITEIEGTSAANMNDLTHERDGSFDAQYIRHTYSDKDLNSFTENPAKYMAGSLKGLGESAGNTLGKFGDGIIQLMQALGIADEPTISQKNQEKLSILLSQQGLTQAIREGCEGDCPMIHKGYAEQLSGEIDVDKNLISALKEKHSYRYDDGALIIGEGDNTVKIRIKDRGISPHSPTVYKLVF